MSSNGTFIRPDLAVLDKYGTVLPEEVIASIRETKVGLKGPITTPVGKGFRSANVALRKSLDLYANLRPAKTYRDCARDTNMSISSSAAKTPRISMLASSSSGEAQSWKND